MKFGLVAACALVAGTVVADHHQANFEGWTHNDLKQYVQDHSKRLENLGSKTLEELKEELGESYEKNAQPKPWWQIWPAHKDPYMSRKGPSSAVSDWFFDTWSDSDLQKYLRQNNVKYDAKASKDQLVKAARDSFHDVSKKLGCSGFYLSNEYFQDWDEDDLKAWLKDYDIDYEKIADNKDALLDKVRENIYHASKLAEEKRGDFLKTLDLANKQIVDSAGSIKDDVFNSWSTENLKQWLVYHKVKIDDKVADNRDELLKAAKKQANYLKDDVDWYLNYMKNKSSRFIKKTPEYAASVWDQTMSKLGGLFFHYTDKTGDAINDTFLVGVEDWSRDRLKTYLDLRGVKYHLLSTNNELRRLAVENRNKPLRKLQENYNKLTEGLTYDNMKIRAQDKADKVQDTDAYNTMSSSINSLNKDTQKWANDFTKKWSDSLTSWSVDDLRNYVKSFGVDPSSLTKEDLITQARVKTQLFFGTFNEPWYARWLYKARFFLRHPFSLFA
ncbi:double-strand break repair enhancer MSC1 TDEL_0B00360 [Torulaspora delbrueckii]|uniref:Meiotic sister chromatid recombination protein 1 n=1 Tax=Torulaspora delbrueckii TaxID=4950 RepID=G8ZNH1_TORDE|nr:hypothetical protein TDEL_0B00360 [Torulaspora delbrueckii]CCE90165.1 hypothetical protein TDEL_0B00360 [Torulaspora delbrueckii]